MLGFVFFKGSIFTIVLFFLSFNHSLFAQTKPSKLSVFGGIEIIPERAIRDSDDSSYTFKGQAFHLKIQVPVWSKRTGNESPRTSSILASGQGKIIRSEIGPNAYLVNLLQVNPGIHYISIGRKNSYLAGFSGVFLQELKTGNANRFWLTGNFLYIRRVNPNWNIRLGAGYSFVFGQGLPLPLVGFSTRITHKGRLNFLFPYHIRYGYRHSSKFRSQFNFGPRGNIGITVPQEIPVQATNQLFYLRNRAFSLDYKAMIGMGDHIQIHLGVGVLFRRQIWVSDEKIAGLKSPDNFYSGTIKPGLFIEVGVRIRPYKLAHREFAKISSTDHDDFQVDDEDLKKIDPDDI